MCLFNVQRKCYLHVLWPGNEAYGIRTASRNWSLAVRMCRSSPVAWIIVEFFYKVTYCCRFLNGKYKPIQSLLKKFPFMLVAYSLCSGNQCWWCNGSFYIIVVCHSHEESIVGAAEIDVLSKNSTDYRTDFPIYRAIFNSLPTAAASLRR